MKRKLISMLLAACMAASAATVGVVQASASEVDPKLAQDTVQGGAILHCFDWSYNNIKANMKDIAEAGYTAVQTSPVQPPKDYTWEGQVYTNTDGQWWKLYQPLGLRVADENSWLGNKAELKAMCDEAEKYGIKVIVDIVANHLANNGNKGGTYANLSSDVDDEMKNAYYYHSDTDGIDDLDRYHITHFHMGQPDLNTGHPDVQDKVKRLLRECYDLGVDGFRFDAAKHIELPTDDEWTGSTFWSAVIGDIKEYSNNSVFLYGEILGYAGTDISNYTEYMAVTDNETGNNARSNAQSGNCEGLKNGWYSKGTAASNCVLWAESHDTYMDNSTSSISDDVITKTWAIVGSRSDSTSLFLARPAANMGDVGTDLSWKSKAVAEVNKFKNVFNGQSEYLACDTDPCVTYNVRGNKGVVMTKLNGSGNVSIDSCGMKEGTYTDHVSGNTFTVANGKINGTIDETGVAVVYNDNDTTNFIDADTLYYVPNYNWKSDGARMAMYVYNSLTGASAWASMSPTAAADWRYSAAVPAGQWTNVIFCRMNGGTTENNWDNKWNQTANLAPTDGTNCFSVSNDGWDNPEGSWNYYGDEHTAMECRNPVWSWSSDYSTADAAFTCAFCNDASHTATLTASGDAVKRSYMYAGKCVYTATVTDAAGTTYQNKTSVDLTAPVVAAKSISLKDEIGVNFYINVPLGTDVSGAEVAYTWDEYEATGTLTESEKYKGLYVAQCGVPAACMTDTVEMTFTCGEASVTDTYSVVSYATDAAAQYANNAKLKRLLCDMLDYGGASQTYFSYRTDAPASAKIEDVDDTWTRDAAVTLDDTSTIQNADLSAYGVKFRGAALSVTSQVTVRLFFDVKNAEVFAGTLASNGEEQIFFADYKGTDMKYLEFTDIAAPDIFKSVKLFLYNGQDNIECQYSPARYYNSVIVKSTDANYVSVMTAMYNYSKSAADYLS